MNFNSIKVQLERFLSAISRYRLQFQFHKGTIRTIVVFRFWIMLMYFNSIKVQLELWSDFFK